MTFDQIFTEYYTLYRGVAQIPTSADDEYTIGKVLANSGIGHWARYDNTYWKQLFTTAQANSTGGVVTITAGTSSYKAPDAFKEPGGFIKIKDSGSNTVRNYSVIEPQEAQFRNDGSTFAYFTGDPSGGYTLNLNQVPDSSINSMAIDYDYYANPALISSGSSVPQMGEPQFLVRYMLAQRFRTSRNPYFEGADDEAQNILAEMKMQNDSGGWANPWKLQDNSGSTWGAGWGSA